MKQHFAPKAETGTLTPLPCAFPKPTPPKPERAACNFHPGRAQTAERVVLLTTTINVPRVLERYRELDRDAQIIVAGDRKHRTQKSASSYLPWGTPSISVMKTRPSWATNPPKSSAGTRSCGATSRCWKPSARSRM